MFGDCHVHMVLDGVYYRDAIAAHRGHVRDDLIRRRLAAYREAGVTYLRDGGDAFGVCLRARELAGEYGIEYRVPVFPMCMKGRYGGFIGREWTDLADYRVLIREVLAAGGDFVKIMISGIMDFDRYGVVTSEPLRALAQSDAVWVPTLSTVGNLIGCGRYPDDVLERILDMQLDNLARCANLGGRIALGSDAGAYRVYHVQAAEDEYRWLKRALGDAADAILASGEAFIRQKFRR